MPFRPIRQQSKEPGPDEVLTVKEIVALVRLGEKTVNAGALPAFGIRGQWRIRRAELERWVDAQPTGGGDGYA